MDAQTKQVIEKVSDGMLAVAGEQESDIDKQLAALEKMDEDDFEVLRQKRRLELQKKARQEQDWKQLGHGSYSEVNDTKDFFNLCKKSERVIAHFFRRSTPRCEIVDAHFDKLAQTHLESRFIKVDVEKNPYLVEKLGIILLPTIVIIIKGHTEHAIHGFDEFGGTDDFETVDVAWVLSQHKVLDYTEADRSEEIAKRGANAGYNSINLRIRAGEYDLDQDDEELFRED